MKWTVLFLPVLCWGPFAARLHAEDLRDIARILRESETSLHSLEVKYIYRSNVEVRCDLVKWGPKWRLVTESAEVGGSWDSFDGEFGYNVVIDAADSSRAARITKSRNKRPGRLGSVPNPFSWWGSAVNLAGVPLHQMVERGTVTGESQFREWPVLDIDLGRWPAASGRLEYDFRCQLSREHDFAPVLIQATPVDGVPLPPQIVEEFREIEHPQLGRRLWLAGNMSYGEGVRIEVVDVTLSPRISESLFRPPPPMAGAELVDETGPGGRKVTIHRPESSRREVIERISEASSDVPASSANSGVVVATADSSPWPTLLVAGGAALAIAAIYLRMRA
ncbi:MAG: hypothetical protein KF774_12240 [Planctomyces sp.]|nr:hypothetical protein [Planctomyces sp.]